MTVIDKQRRRQMMLLVWAYGVCVTDRVKLVPCFVEWFFDWLLTGIVDNIFNVGDEDCILLVVASGILLLKRTVSQVVIFHLDVLDVDRVELHVNCVQIKVLLDHPPTHTQTHTHVKTHQHHTQVKSTLCMQIQFRQMFDTQIVWRRRRFLTVHGSSTHNTLTGGDFGADWFKMLVNARGYNIQLTFSAKSR